MLKTILALLTVAVVLVLGLAAMSPNSIHIERQIAIKSTPDAVFDMLNDFRQWTKWSPWDALDPQMKRSYAGPANGKGAIFEWDGNKQVGAGRMQIIESSPYAKLLIQQDFTRPYVTRNSIEFSLQNKGDDTIVVWSMHMPAPFLSKVMQLFVSFDREIGNDFDKGLTNLKRVVEGK